MVTAQQPGPIPCIRNKRRATRAGLEAGGEMSNQRGLVSRIERKLENTVGDAVARVFGGSIVPQEVEELLRREASDGVQTLQGGRFLAPNDYVINLSGSDFEKVSAIAISHRTLLPNTWGDTSRNRDGKRMVMSLSGSSVRPTCTLANTVRVASSIRMPAPTDRRRNAPAESKDAFTAEPGVPPMSDTRVTAATRVRAAGDDYYEDRYARPATSSVVALPLQQRGPYRPTRSFPATPRRASLPTRRVAATPNRAATSRATPARAAT